MNNTATAATNRRTMLFRGMTADTIVEVTPAPAFAAAQYPGKEAFRTSKVIADDLFMNGDYSLVSFNPLFVMDGSQGGLAEISVDTVSALVDVSRKNREQRRAETEAQRGTYGTRHWAENIGR